MTRVRKILLLIIILLTVVCLFTGCRKEPPSTELHWWQTPVYDSITGIIYEVRSTPTEIIDNRLLWNVEDVELELYFGRDIERLKNYEKKYEGPDLICFAAYFYWTEERTNDYNNEDFSDYKNPPNAFFLKEYSPDEFLSEKYVAEYGKKRGLLNSYPTVFNELHEPLIVTVPKEVFRISEEKMPHNNVYEFCFGVVPVYYRETEKTYFFGPISFGENDGIKFRYDYYESGKISIGI